MVIVVVVVYDFRKKKSKINRPSTLTFSPPPPISSFPFSQRYHAQGINKLVLVVDDDTHYPPRLLETLLLWHKEFPNAALSFRGWVVHKDKIFLMADESYVVFGSEVKGAFCFFV